MISEETVKKFFTSCQNHFQEYLKEYWQIDTSDQLIEQIFRGVPSEGTNCRYLFLVFQTYNIIPESCFDCYKILIEPRNVVELFKLMLVFEKLVLPNDNSRKCMIEIRPETSGTYKGLVYSFNLNEANNLLNIVRKVISQEISADVPVNMKRGCSEYSLVYQKYAMFKKNGKPIMQYKKKWQKYEKLAERINLGRDLVPIPKTFNKPGYDLNDAKAMIAWLKYAATINDLSYKKITDQDIRQLSDLNRPPFKEIK